MKFYYFQKSVITLF